MSGLERFYTEINLKNLPQFNDWNFTKNRDGEYLHNPCHDGTGKSWPFVECDRANSEIIGLYFENVLANVDVDGIMSPLVISDDALAGLADIGTLSTLDMSRNKIVGTLPSSINSVESLEVLTLNNNFFTGQFPVDLSRMTNLSSVTLSYGNKFSGTFDSEWFCRMTHLDVKMNSFA